MQPYSGLSLSDNTPKIFSVKDVLLDAQTERNLDLTARLQVERYVCILPPPSSTSPDVPRFSPHLSAAEAQAQWAEFCSREGA